MGILKVWCTLSVPVGSLLIGISAEGVPVSTIVANILLCLEHLAPSWARVPLLHCEYWILDGCIQCPILARDRTELIVLGSPLIAGEECNVRC